MALRLEQNDHHYAVDIFECKLKITHHCNGLKPCKLQSLTRITDGPAHWRMYEFTYTSKEYGSTKYSQWKGVQYIYNVALKYSPPQLYPTGYFKFIPSIINPVIYCDDMYSPLASSGTYMYDTENMLPSYVQTSNAKRLLTKSF